ncbi:cellulose biosynthesis protein BcsS [Noviherbaspirillum malthae]|uniref:cellulose biosynthesis protein BcsS n=1 Tax=Noviherbaspirillum malthae TaxID=1260987 RepID=UPI00188DC97E|nr:cellulose biosynthesis protein BcsS [Noviherbaspirillum malthae]
MRKHVLVSLAATVALAFSLAASAQELTGVAIGGVQYSPDSSYTYAGMLKSFPGGRLGEGWYSKVIASWLTYRYDTNISGTDYEIRARAPGIEGGVGYGWKRDRYTLSLSGSIGLRHITVKPIVPDNEETGNVWTFNPQLQGTFALTPKIEAGTLASYAFGQKSAYAQARLAWKPSGTWFVGLQEIYLKGRNYRINQHGIVVGRPLANGYTLEISGGRSRPRDSDSTGYIAFGLSRVF